MQSPNVSVIMGSQSDWPTMSHACQVLEQLEIVFEKRIISAHRTPERLFQFAKSAAVRSIRVIIAGAGGAAHLPGMVASLTTLPVLGVPIESRTLKGLDSLMSIVQMPSGVPVATLAIGVPGAKNAALLAAAIIALNDEGAASRLNVFRNDQTQNVPIKPAEGPK